MAHGGEEGALRLSRLLGRLPGSLKLTDVVVDPIAADELALHEDGGDEQLDVDQRAVLTRSTSDQPVFVLGASPVDFARLGAKIHGDGNELIDIARSPPHACSRSFSAAGFQDVTLSSRPTVMIAVGLISRSDSKYCF